MRDFFTKNTLNILAKGSLLGVIAFVANILFAIPVYGSETISWGLGIALFTLISFGLSPAIIVFAFCITSLFLLAQDWFLTATTILEFVFIAICIKKRLFIIMASLCFWIFIGSPLLFVSVHFSSEAMNSQGYEYIYAASAGLNGLFNASLAAMLYLLTPTRWLNEKASRVNQKLSSNIFALSALTLILPVVTVSLFMASSASERNQKQVVKILRAQANSLSLATDNFINQHFTVIQQLANTLSLSDDKVFEQKLLVKAQEQFPDFFNITVIRADGYTEFFAPIRYNEELSKLPPNLRYVNDRRYFAHSKQNMTPYVSQAMMSRGVISVPMIAMSSPIIEDGEFAGALLGAMNLSNVRTLHHNMVDSLQTDSVIITDESNYIVYASAPLKLKPLEKFELKSGKSVFVPEFPMLALKNKSYLYHAVKNSHNWNVYIIKQPEELVRLYSQHIIVLWLVVVGIILIFLLIAHKLSKRITSPLVALLENSSESYISNFEVEQDATSSREINEVAAKLRKSHHLLRDFEDQLQQQVNEKTTQLEQMNLQLAAQAREDGLTSLLNRSGFDEIANNAIKTNQRLHQPISLALIDIDDFKLINDSYGHPVGDECLKAFAELMQSNCKRETDIIGRYGGEEFVILMAGKDVTAHHQLMHNIRVQTQDLLVHPVEMQSPISFTISIGLCSLLGSSQLGLHEVINIADEELYKCKRNGKNQLSIVTIDPE
jgi:diguanylate cyclase (GGDEF)-like protein